MSFGCVVEASDASFPAVADAADVADVADGVGSNGFSMAGDAGLARWRISYTTTPTIVMAKRLSAIVVKEDDGDGRAGGIAT